jgi:hypothetical protein
VEGTRVFKTDLQPSWFFRQLPSGGYWYLIYKYRRNQFDPMLRKYLDRLTMKQLQIPMFTVSVDLVEGQAIVRDTGDATTNVLESINLPPLSLPLCSSGQAVVDGGLLNNIPADVLVDVSTPYEHSIRNSPALCKFRAVRCQSCLLTGNCMRSRFKLNL